jgi:hypothetical protein
VAEEQENEAELPPLRIDETERIFRFAQKDRCSKLASDRGIKTFDAVLDDERLPEKFQDRPPATDAGPDLNLA